MHRFKIGKKEVTVERVQSESMFYVDKVLVPGDFILFKYGLNNFLCAVGQIIKFKYLEGTSKKDRRYPYNNVIIGVNKNVSICLSPCFFIDKKGKIVASELKYFDVLSYLCSTRKDVLNFSRNRLNNRHFLLLKENFFPNLY